MELLFILAPGFISSALLEKLQKKTFSAYSHFRHTIVFDFFINIAAIIIYEYIYRGQTGILENFQSNRFLLRFALLSIVLAVFAAVAYYFCSPYFQVTVDTIRSRSQKKAGKEEYES